MQIRQLDFIFASRYEANSGSEDDTIITLIGNYIFTYIGKIFFNVVEPKTTRSRQFKEKVTNE